MRKEDERLLKEAEVAEARQVKLLKDLVDRAKKNAATPLAKLHTERAESAVEIFIGIYERVKSGKVGLDALAQSAFGIRAAFSGVNLSREDRISLGKFVLEILTGFEKQAIQLKDAGLMTSSQVATARLARLEMEIEVTEFIEDAKAKPSGSVPEPVTPQPALKLEGSVSAVLKREPLVPAAGDDELLKLLKARYNSAVTVAQVAVAGYTSGRGESASVWAAIQLLLAAELELTADPKEKVQIHERNVQLAQEIEEVLKARIAAKIVPSRDLPTATYNRLDAEVQLLRAKRAAQTTKPLGK